MNLVQEKPINENNQKKLKVSLVVVIVLIVLLVAIAIFLYLYMQKELKKQLKVEIDGIPNSNLSKSNSNVFFINNGKVYTSISNIAKEVGYTYYPGEYKEYTESKNSCYVTNSSELVDFTANSNKIRKYPLLSQSEPQDFEIDEPVSERGANLYLSESGLERAFNLKISYDQSQNKITIMTLGYITSKFESGFSNVIITKSEFPKDVIFNDQKALLSNLVVVKDTSSDSNLYGVSLYKDNQLSSVIISPRYTSIEYIEGLDDFIVKTEDNKFGIIGKDGITKVKPSYDAISEIDKNYGLYLVTSGQKQGVVNQNGKIIVYQDYDQVGLDKDNQDNNVKNRYLLLNNCIPVKANNKWGLIDKDGNQITPLEYDTIGCATIKNSNTSSNSVGITLIPDMDGIVVGNTYETENAKINKYGIVNSKGKLIVGVTADYAFAVTLENVTKYYLLINNQNIDIVDYWNKYTANIENNAQENQNAIQNQNVVVTTQGDATVQGTTQGTAAEGTAAQGATTEGTATEGTATQGTATQGTAAQGTAAQGTAAQGTATEGTAAQGVATQGTT